MDSFVSLKFLLTSSFNHLTSDPETKPSQWSSDKKMNLFTNAAVFTVFIATFCIDF